jgi:hypothetical protein
MSQFGVAWTRKQLPASGSPHAAPVHLQSGKDVAACTHAVSHAVLQQKGSRAQTARQQSELEQFGTLLGTQQLASRSLPQEGTGHASDFPAHDARASDAHTESQTTSQQ